MPGAPRCTAPRRRRIRSPSMSPGDCELAKTPEGYYQVRGGISYAVAKSLAAAPFADLLWMETKTADLDDARSFADAIHARFPDKMLAYNLSPSFGWDTTGMTDDEMRRFPEDLGTLGFVFNFITYGGHQIDGVAAEEFATALRQDGMLALARLQRKIRLVDSPYKTPQTLAGGTAFGRGPLGVIRTDRYDHGHGPRVHATPASGPGRSTDAAPRGVARPVERELQPGTDTASPAAASSGRLGAARAEHPRRVRRQAGRCGVCSYQGSAGPQDSLDPRPEHLRYVAASETP